MLTLLLGETVAFGYTYWTEGPPEKLQKKFENTSP